VLRLVGQRLLTGLLVLWAAATIAFFALQLIPGDEVDTILGAQVSASPALRAQVREDLGLDQPVWEQYMTEIRRLATGDLGTSYQLRTSVWETITSQLPSTLQLAAAATLLALVFALLSALLTAGRGRVRGLVSGLELAAASTPSFWLGIVLLTFLSFRLRLFPAAGADSLAALVLPAVTLALPIGAELSQVLRENLERTLERPFIVSVRARGFRESVVLVRHALRHASLPLVTMTGWVFGALFSGAVLIEAVFSRPGLGRVLLTAVSGKDMPVVTGIVLLSALGFLIVNLVVDLLYLALDPRLRR
jgi:peptide/nickel transport system permease protein